MSVLDEIAETVKKIPHFKAFVEITILASSSATRLQLYFTRLFLFVAPEVFHLFKSEGECLYSLSALLIKATKS